MNLSLTLFLLSMFIAVLGPWMAMAYLRPILRPVLQRLCDAGDVAGQGAEFWLRCAQLLALCGSVLLMLGFGDFTDSVHAVDAMRRTLWLVFCAVFVTVAILARVVWRQIRPQLTLAANPASGNTSV